MEIMSDAEEKEYSEYTDFELANAYFNNILYNQNPDNNPDEYNAFWEEVDRRKGGMLRLEWLDYHY